MAFYKLKKIAGGHNQDGRNYVAGDVVETEMDLVKRWPTKFELMHDEGLEDTGVTAPDIVTPAGEDDTVTEKVNVKASSGKDAKKSKKKAAAKSTPVEVTSDYPDAEDIGVQVFKKVKSNGDWFFVTDPDDDNAQMNEKLLREKDVAPFIESITEDEDEE